MSLTTVHRVHVVPNVTPMIDVMLVLLIIFMVTTPALLDGATVEPPEAEHVRTYSEEPTDHVITIDPHGGIYLDRHRVAREQLGAEILKIFLKTTDRLLFVRAHKDLAYGDVDRVLQIARASGAQVVGMLSEMPPASR